MSMNYFLLTPPLFATATIKDFSFNEKGETVSHFIISFNNGKGGENYRSGFIKSTRRSQNGYDPLLSKSVIESLEKHFEGTRWFAVPHSGVRSKETNSITFNVMRDLKEESTPTIIRSEEGVPIAFFPTLLGKRDPNSVICYTIENGHGFCDKDYYNKTNPATREEIDKMLVALRNSGYKPNLINRWNVKFDDIRIAKVRESRKS